jgi:hypothetical protein
MSAVLSSRAPRASTRRAASSRRRGLANRTLTEGITAVAEVDVAAFMLAGAVVGVVDDGVPGVGFKLPVHRHCVADLNWNPVGEREVVVDLDLHAVSQQHQPLVWPPLPSSQPQGGAAGHRHRYDFLPLSNA